MRAFEPGLRGVAVRPAAGAHRCQISVDSYGAAPSARSDLYLVSVELTARRRIHGPTVTEPVQPPRMGKVRRP